MRGGRRWNPKGEMNPAFKGGIVADRDWMAQKYMDEGLSLRQIAKQAGRSLRTVARWMEVHGIVCRSLAEGIRKSRKTGSESPLWRGGFPKCNTCGRTVGRGNVRCLPCYWEQRTAGKHPSFKGLADVKQTLRSYVHDNWRPKIFERDRYSCQKCGDNRGRNLCAHHIERFEVIINRLLKPFPLDTVEQRLTVIEELRKSQELNDLENGVTLCETCHRNLHYGRRKDHVHV